MARSRYAIQIVGLAGIITSRSAETLIGHYVSQFDPDAHDGQGLLLTTPVIGDAVLFDSPAAAYNVWRQRSRTKPNRDDGRPNRPLTAFTVEIAEVPAAALLVPKEDPGD